MQRIREFLIELHVSAGIRRADVHYVLGLQAVAFLFEPRFLVLECTGKIRFR